MKKLAIAILCLAVTAASGCDGSPPTTDPNAQIQLSASPASIIPTVCPPSSCGAGSDEVEAITTIALRETAGGSGILDGFTIVLTRASDNATILATTIGIGAGTRFTANQTVNIPFAIHFGRAGAASAMSLSVRANARDDRGNGAVTATLTIPVAAFPG
jgi:hypothetical protein